MSSKATALVFPGQGSQKPGMGKDFHDTLAVSRHAYTEASDALGWDVAAMCFGEDERLNLTAYTQPCILTTEIAMLRGIQEMYGFAPTLFGGHSLGEFTALVAAGAMPLADAACIVHARGSLMQEASPVGFGGMAAIIAADLDIAALQQALADLPLDFANINATNQVVISGEAAALPDAAKRVAAAMKEGQAHRFITLNVSAPFHSRFMKPVEDRFAAVLDTYAANLSPEKAVSVTSNFRGGFHGGALASVREALIRQIAGSVRWMDNMKALVDVSGAIYEIGPGRPLRDFFKSVGVECSSTVNLSTAAKLFGGEAEG